MTVAPPITVTPDEFFEGLKGFEEDAVATVFGGAPTTLAETAPHRVTRALIFVHHMRQPGGWTRDRMDAVFRTVQDLTIKQVLDTFADVDAEEAGKAPSDDASPTSSSPDGASRPASDPMSTAT